MKNAPGYCISGDHFNNLKVINESGGKISGEGKIDNLVFENQGILSPGFSPGKITIEGDYSNRDGTVIIEIGETNHDLLEIQGNFEGGGTLDIDLIDGFVPTPGNTYTIVTSDLVTPASNFSTINLPLALQGWQVNVVQSTINEIVLSYSGSIPCTPDLIIFPEDANGSYIAGSSIATDGQVMVTLPSHYTAPEITLNAGFEINANVAFEITNGSCYEMIMDVEGNVYRTVKIGTQEWMADNLKTTHLNDGTLLTKHLCLFPLNNGEPGYSWYDDDSIANHVSYGPLYNPNVVSSQDLCPVGWRIPTDADWNTLLNSLVYESAGRKLAEVGTEHWDPPNAGATNETGFSAIPGGFQTQTLNCRDKGKRASFASSSDRHFDVILNADGTYTADLFLYPTIDGGSASVRCIKD